MIIYVFRKKGDDLYNKIIQNIRYNLNKKMYYNKLDIKLYFTLRCKVDIDLFLIMSNDINYIINKSKLIKDKNKIIIITNIIKYSDITTCLNITNNLINANSNIEKMILKIIIIYNKNLLIGKKK